MRVQALGNLQQLFRAFAAGQLGRSHWCDVRLPLAVDVGETQAQGVVVGDQSIQRGLDDGRHQATVAVGQYRLVPVRDLDLLLVEEPLVQWHQRHRPGHVTLFGLGQQRRGHVGQGRWGWRTEQVPWGERIALFTQARDQFQAEDRVTAQGEETVRGADFTATGQGVAEQLAEQLAEQAFQIVARCRVVLLGVRQGQGGEGLAVDLAVGAQGQGRDLHPYRRHHVGRQLGRELGVEVRLRGATAVERHQAVVDDQGAGTGDGRQVQQG